MMREKPADAASTGEATIEEILKEMQENLIQNETEIEGIKRQFPTIAPPKRYKDRLDELSQENTNLRRWIGGAERLIKQKD